jgi:hypothetical protein
MISTAEELLRKSKVSNKQIDPSSDVSDPAFTGDCGAEIL